MKRIRIVDLPMIVKIGFAPALAMVMMVLLSANSVFMLQRQAELLNSSAVERMAQVKGDQELTIQLTLAGLLVVGLLATIAILNVRRSIAGIAGATEALAQGKRDLDLDAMKRNDELGAIVRSLIVFDASARK